MLLLSVLVAYGYAIHLTNDDDNETIISTTSATPLLEPNGSGMPDLESNGGMDLEPNDAEHGLQLSTSM